MSEICGICCKEQVDSEAIRDLERCCNISTRYKVLLGYFEYTSQRTVKTRPAAEKTTKKSDGSLCKNPEENAEVFREHFKQLYGRNPMFDATILNQLNQNPTIPGCDHCPTDTEIRCATRKLKNKAPGDSGLAPQV